MRRAAQRILDGEAGAQHPDRLALSLLGMMAGYATFYCSKPPDVAERASILNMARSMVERAVRKGKGPVRAVRSEEDSPVETPTTAE